jgi:WD40 repeat protein
MIKLWNLESLEQIVTLEGHSNKVNSVSFSPDGEYLASGSDDYTVKLWSVESHKEVASLETHEYGVNSIAFSTDGKYLASGSDD